MVGKLQKTYKLIVKILMVFAVVFMLEVPMQVHAAPKTMPDGNVFDAEFYANTYPDVKAAFGTDETALYNHYLMFGMKEGRLPYAPATQQMTVAPISATSVTVQIQSVYDKIMALKEVYPDGMKWDSSNTYVLAQDENRDNGWGGCEFSACQAFAYQIQDTVFGTSAKVTSHKTGLSKWCTDNAGGKIIFSSKNPAWIPEGYTGQDEAINAKFEEYWVLLQAGDIVVDGNHSAVVLTKGDDYITVAEGNNGGKVKWGRKISKDLLRVSLMTVESPSW